MKQLYSMGFGIVATVCLAALAAPADVGTRIDADSAREVTGGGCGTMFVVDEYECTGGDKECGSEIVNCSSDTYQYYDDQEVPGGSEKVSVNTFGNCVVCSTVSCGIYFLPTGTEIADCDE